MKTAYELAMERLSQAAPSVKLTAEQKKRLAELDSKYAAKIAEREITISGELERAVRAGDAEKADQLRRQLTNDRQKLQAELQDRKQRLRAQKA